MRVKSVWSNWEENLTRVFSIDVSSIKVSISSLFS